MFLASTATETGFHSLHRFHLAWSPGTSQMQDVIFLRLRNQIINSQFDQ